MSTSGKRPRLGRPRKPPSERRSIVVNVRLTPPEFQVARKIADERKIDVPDVLRAPISKLVNKQSTKG